MNQKKIKPDQKKLKLLFKKAEIGKLKCKNRIIMSPMGIFFRDCLDGIKLAPHVIDFYEARAKGGAGMIIISPSFYFQMLKGVDNKQPFAMWHDKFIDPMRELVQAVHKHDSLAGLHFTHMGSFAAGALTGSQPVSVSGNFVNPWTKETPHELTGQEIKDVVANLAYAAGRAKKAGFDFIEFNAYSGYLIREFLSSAYNDRKDEYGGPIENRLLFFKEVIYAAKEIVGDDYPIIAKISGDEYLPGGNTWKEAIEIARALERWGIDAIHVSPGGHDARIPLTLGFVPKGAFTYLAKAVKEIVSTPVITTHVDDLFLAEKILSSGDADFIGFGRQFLADQNFPVKAANGRFEDIRPCIRCNQGCYDKVIRSQNVTCLMNPAVGREKEFEISPVSEKKNIMIVGGGPGGLKCAQELAERGHKVSLYEKKSRLGGQMYPCAAIYGKAEFMNAVEYFKAQLARLGVNISLDTEVTREMVEDQKPDTVIIATGVKPVIPALPGIERKEVVTAFDVLERRVSTGGRVVIIGGGSIGCDTALFLAKEGAMDAESAMFFRQWGGVSEEDILYFVHKGKQVTVLEMGASVASDVIAARRSLLRRLLAMNKVEVITEAEVTAVTDQGVEFIKEDQRQYKKADTVVIAAGVLSENRLYTALQGKVPDLHIIGDAKKPGKAIDAIFEAAELALDKLASGVWSKI